MPKSLELETSMVVRREAVNLPSLWAHSFWAITVLILSTLAVILYIRSFGQPEDARPRHIIAIEAIPTPMAADTLDGQSGALPDLLAGVVPENTNPTEDLEAFGLSEDLTDALGNPVNANTDANLSAGTQLTLANISEPTSRTILIDGRPVSTANSALIKAPIQGLTRQSPFGLLPTPSADGRSPLSAYARPFSAPPERQRISIIIGGLGINTALTNRAIDELPPEVTLSFAAHTSGLQGWIDRARAKGHEVLLEIPMETENFDITEKGAERAMRTTPDAARNIRNLDWLMSRAQGYFGVTNYNGDKFLSRADVVAPVMGHISNAGLGFIFDGAFTAPSLLTIADSTNLPYQTAFTLIDQSQNRQAINAELSRMSAAAQNSTHPIGVGFAFPDTLDAVSAWAARLEETGLVLAPASATLL